MPERIELRKKTRKRRYIDRKQRREQQRRLQKRIDEAIGGLIRQGFQEALRDEVTELLGRAKGERRDLGDETEVEASCNKCQGRLRRDFYRAGFYRRSILTFEVWLEIKMPRVSCICGGMVDCESVHLEPYGRVWFDASLRSEPDVRYAAAPLVGCREPRCISSPVVPP